MVGDELWKYPRLIVVCLPDIILRTIEEDILFYGVAVEVEEHDESALVLAFEPYHELLEGPHFGDQEVIIHLEGPVKVSPAEGSSKVTDDHSIGVQHRNDLEDHVPA